MYSVNFYYSCFFEGLIYLTRDLLKSDSPYTRLQFIDIGVREE